MRFGSNMTIKIPLTLAIIDGIIVEVGTNSYVFSTADVQGFVRIDKSLFLFSLLSVNLSRHTVLLPITVTLNAFSSGGNSAAVGVGVAVGASVGVGLGVGVAVGTSVGVGLGIGVGLDIRFVNRYQHTISFYSVRSSPSLITMSSGEVSPRTFRATSSINFLVFT